MNAEKNTIDAFATTPIHKSTIIMGIHAIAGIFLIKSKNGLRASSIGSHQAMIIPSGTPTMEPKQNPITDTLRLANMWLGRVEPSGRLLVHL